MPASYAKGILLGYSGWMTSHWNGKDRWSRHYGCSQTLFHLPFLEQNTSGLMSDSFWKVNLGKMRWVHWTDTTIQFLYSYLQGFYFCSFFYWLFTVCKLPVLDNKILSNSDYQRMGCVCDNHLSLMGSLVSWLRIFERWKKLRAVTCVKVTAYKTSFEKCSNEVQVNCSLPHWNIFKTHYD